MNGFCIQLFTVLSLGIALAGQSQPPASVKVSKTLPPEVRKLKKETALADTLRIRGLTVVPFLQRFQTGGTTYQEKYQAQRAEEHRKQCEPMLAARQEVVDQLSRIEQLLSAQNLAQLLQEKAVGNLPIIDTIKITQRQLQLLTIRYAITEGMGCYIPEIDLSVYPTLMMLQRQKLVVIFVTIQALAAVEISRLPSLTGNTRTDAANYLQAIRQLLGFYYNQLQTTYPQYRTYERGQNLNTDMALLNFRREFCCGILCDVASK